MAELINAIVSIIAPVFDGMNYLVGQLITATPSIGGVTLGTWFIMFFGLGTFIGALK